MKLFKKQKNDFLSNYINEKANHSFEFPISEIKLLDQTIGSVINLFDVNWNLRCVFLDFNENEIAMEIFKRTPELNVVMAFKDNEIHSYIKKGADYDSFKTAARMHHFSMKSMDDSDNDIIHYTSSISVIDKIWFDMTRVRAFTNCAGNIEPEIKNA